MSRQPQCHFQSRNKNAKSDKRRTLQRFVRVLVSCALIAALYPARISAQSVSVVQRATLNQQPSSSGTVTLTLPKATAAGHALIVGVSFWPLDLTSVSDTAGDSFTRGIPTSIFHNVSQGVLYTNFYYAKTTAGGANTITLHFSGGQTYLVAAVSEVAGLDPSAPLDKSVYNESLTSTSPWSSASLTTAAANEYLFAWAADEWNDPSCSKPTSGWSDTQNTSGGALCLLDRTVSTAGTYRVSVTPSRAFNYAMELVGFKGASAAVTPPAPLSVSTTSLPNGMAGTSYATSLSATGGAPPYNWTDSGLPSGLSMNSTGAITGTPSAAGTQTASITVKDSAGATASSSLPLTIATQAISVAISPTAATVAGGQSQTFAATVSGTSNAGVNWYVSGVQGGNASVGTISSSGVYTAPACPNSSAVVVTAQSAYAPATQATANVTLTTGAGSSLARYVATTGSDSNNGSACSPWATIQNAANNAQPGMTIHVAPGTYTVSSTITSNPAGTATSRIRYISDVQWAAKIVSSADPIWNNNGAYVDIMGFDISGGGTSYTGIHSQGSYDRSIGNRIHDFGSTGCNAGAGVMIGGGANNQSAIANIVYNVGPLPPAVPGCNLIHGIYVSTAGAVVANNLTFNNSAKGIQLWGVPTNCIVINNTSFHNQDGMVLGNDGAGGSTLDNSIIANNITYNNVRYGMYESGSMGTHNQYLNNLIYADPGGTYMITGQLTNTVSTNPQFVNYTGDASGNYQLGASSPAIGAGTSTDAPSTDLDGGARPQASRFDMGAYEYGAAPASWPWMQ